MDRAVLYTCKHALSPSSGSAHADDTVETRRGFPIESSDLHRTLLPELLQRLHVIWGALLLRNSNKAARDRFILAGPASQWRACLATARNSRDRGRRTPDSLVLSQRQPVAAYGTSAVASAAADGNSQFQLRSPHVQTSQQNRSESKRGSRLASAHSTKSSNDIWYPPSSTRSITGSSRLSSVCGFTRIFISQHRLVTIHCTSAVESRKPLPSRPY